MEKINKKLLELNDRYAELYPNFYISELLFIQKRSKIMLEQYGNFSSQPTRDAATEKLLSKSPEYEKYHQLKPEMDIITTQIAIYKTVSRNMNAMQWEVK